MQAQPANACETSGSRNVDLVLHSMSVPLILIGAAHLLISLSTNSRRYSGDRRFGATAEAATALNLSCTAGVFNVAIVAVLSLRMIGSGVPLGMKKPYQFGASKSNSPCSCALASCGNADSRPLPSVAIPFTLLVWISGIMVPGSGH